LKEIDERITIILELAFTLGRKWPKTNSN